MTLIWVLVGLVVLSVAAFILFRLWDVDELFTIFVSAVSMIIAVIMAIGIPINHYSYKADIREYYATKATIEAARNSGTATELERATLTQKIIDMNIWLSEAKYQKHKGFYRIAVPDEIDELEYLK